MGKTAKVAGIYQILHKTSGRRYIGSSINVYSRLSHHKDRLKQNKHANDYLQKTYNKYGPGDFELKQILVCEPKDLELYEQLIIDNYKTNERAFGFNLRRVAKSNAGMLTKRNTNKPGNKYNRLTLIEPRHIRGDRRYWLCQCDCGNLKEIVVSDVRSGHSKSCGCLNTERISERIKQWNLDHPEPWNKKNPAGGGNDALSKLIGG